MKPILGTIVLAALGFALWTRGQSTLNTETYCGSCDASAAIALNDDLFVVADDENSVMRIYSRANGQVAVYRTNMASFLGFLPGDEADIEGSARIGDTLFWITSHGNNRKGKEQESRQRFFAVTTRWNGSNATLSTVGRPYTGLLDDLLRDPRLARYGLHAAANLPPKTPGAINIEGLTATPDGQLLIGFRNPVPRGGALLVPLLNPKEVVLGARAQFGEPRQVQLEGYGIRSIEPWRNGYLIIAGSVDGKGKSRLYEWSGGSDAPRPVPNVDFKGINPEALAVLPGAAGDELLVISDDGTRLIGGVECKRLRDPAKQVFRAVRISISPELAARN